jgi:ABC-type cobalamin/Fe3+-siderophores transport system ATPase subunit
MYLRSISIRNYKSYLDSGDIRFDPGFNVIVGQNDSGKSALLEAASLRFEQRPHLSLKTVPNRDEPPPELASSCLAEMHVEAIDVVSVIGSRLEVVVKTRQGLTEGHVLTTLNDFATRGGLVRALWHPGSMNSAELCSVDWSGTPAAMSLVFANARFESVNSTRTSDTPPGDHLVGEVANRFWKRIYAFRAERLNVGEANISVSSELSPNASNLAAVLHLLSSSNSARFNRLVRNVNTVFPHIRGITARPVENNRARILVWSVDPETERDDLAVPLAQSGTGVGQVLAILYVIMTSSSAKTLIIDEPQSFLHPGAARKLLSIFKEHPQHQYIISTHSPTALMATAGTIYVARRADSETIIERVDAKNRLQLEGLLAEVGVRLSDVFGADRVLWVEGPTEERCYPVIAETLGMISLQGTVIVGVVNTGDFEGRRTKATYDLYDRLSTKSALLPPLVGFIFDQDGRSANERQRWETQSGSAITFLDRRLYENYLIDAEAIAHLLNSVDIDPATGRKQSAVTAADVADWITKHGEDPKYFKDAEKTAKLSESDWAVHVHGASLLRDACGALTDLRVNYGDHKADYGLRLTQWLIDNRPSALTEIVERLKSKLAQSS